MQKESIKTVDIWCPYTGETLDITPGMAAAITGRAIQTCRRWAAGRPIPPPDLHLLRFRVLGLLDHPDWSHFRLQGGFLRDLDTGEAWRPYHLRTALLQHQRADLMRAELNEYRNGRHQPRQQLALIR